MKKRSIWFKRTYGFLLTPSTWEGVALQYGSVFVIVPLGVFGMHMEQTGHGPLYILASFLIFIIVMPIVAFVAYRHSNTDGH